MSYTKHASRVLSEYLGSDHATAIPLSLERHVRQTCTVGTTPAKKFIKQLYAVERVCPSVISGCEILNLQKSPSARPSVLAREATWVVLGS